MIRWLIKISILLFLLINSPEKHRLTVSFSNRLQVLADFAYQMPIHDRMTPTATNQSRTQTGLPSSFHNTQFSDSTHCRTRSNLVLLFFFIFWPWKVSFNGFILEPTSSPGRFRASKGDTEHDAASALRGQCNDVITLERCSCGRFAALMVGNSSRFFRTGGLTSSPLCSARVEMHWLKVGKMMMPGFAFCSV